ncbi:MAG: hypothetical protein P8L70_05360 [Halioglobus sp.]|jgi:hypothetical protein|nr:hypothetical protein GPB2148_3838 [marine gamma proteobacterium HTCC2148]MBT3411022.1 hypothetical protein [Halieaceae bacterium]MDG1390205.1 hypothetical protein [Halioglobus sp.]MBT6126520.1 hypothetical protein [Halieaceae bacterium]MBT7718096.1 hypothetical protein [Halieaceae bacterium]
MHISKRQSFQQKRADCTDYAGIATASSFFTPMTLLLGKKSMLLKY